jgi:putative transposase
MDEQHLVAAARYIELNPVRARLVKKPGDYQWSSAKAHLQGRDDILVKIEPLSVIVKSWKDLLKTDVTEEEKETLRSHKRTGRPLGSSAF